MKALKITTGVALALALGAITLTTPSTPAKADPASCLNVTAAMNVDIGIVMDSTQPISRRVLAMTNATNFLADCLDQPHPTPGCFNSASYRLPFAAGDMGFMSGMGTAFQRLGLAFPSPSVNGDVFFIYNQLAFYVNEIGSCTN
jgi:hypothetical protein